MRVLWSAILKPELYEIYENMRTLPTSTKPGRRVGWDMLCEWLNGAISEGVLYSVSEERITEFIKDFPFMDHVRSTIREFSNFSQTERERKLKDMDVDVAKLVDLFRSEIGADWNAATTQRTQRESRLLRRIRHKCPWLLVRETMTKRGNESVPAFVANTVRRLTATWYSFAA